MSEAALGLLLLIAVVVGFVGPRLMRGSTTGVAGLLMRARGIRPSGPDSAWMRNDRLRAAGFSAIAAIGCVVVVFASQVVQDVVVGGTAIWSAAYLILMAAVFGGALAVLMSLWHLIRAPLAPAGGPRLGIPWKVPLAGVVGFGLIVVTMIVDGTSHYSVPDGTSLFDVLPGTWTWLSKPTGCQDDPQVISFAADRRQMFITTNHAFRDATGKVESRTPYDIISVSTNRLRGQIPGEIRRTSDGKPVVWDIVMKSRDRFAWHRTDWAFWSVTGDLVRCGSADQWNW